MEKNIKSVYAHFLLSYLLILIIPLLIGIYAYYKTVGMLEDNAREATLSTLEQSKNIIDTRFGEIEQLINKLSTNQKVNSFKLLKSPLNEEGLFMQYEVTQELADFDTNKFITGLYIYFQNNDTLITANAAYKGRENYDDFFRYANLTYSQWMELINGAPNNILPAAFVQYKGMGERRIVYLKALSFPYGGSSDGFIAVLVDEAQIIGFLQNIVEEGGYAYILDNQGKQIVATDSRMPSIPMLTFTGQTQNGYLQSKNGSKNMLITYTVSAYNGWRYVAEIPQSKVLANTVYIKKMIWSIAAIALLTGAFIAAYLSYRNSLPWKELNELTEDFRGGAYSRRRIHLFEAIQGAIQELLNTNKQMQSELSEHHAILRNTFIHRIIRGEFVNEEEMVAFMQNAGISFPYKLATVALLREEKLDPVSSSGYFIGEVHSHNVDIKNRLMYELNEFRCIEFARNDGTWGVLIGCDEPNEGIGKAKIDQAMNRAIQAHVRFSPIDPIIGIGRLYSSLMQVWQSVNEASEALEYHGHRTPLVWYDQIPRTSNEYHYPIDLEKRLINFVHSGNSEKVKSTIEDIRFENFENRYLAPRMRLQLIHELKGTLIKLAGKHNDDGQSIKEIVDFTDYTEDYRLEDLYRKVCAMIIEISEGIHIRNTSHQTLLKDQLMDIINSSYTDPGFCLAQLADKIQLSESYVSFFFKEATGETFSAYLENLRLTYATRLLRETQISIQDISGMAGYTSDKVFRRAFKRMLGVQPTAYRNLELDVHGEK